MPITLPEGLIPTLSKANKVLVLTGAGMSADSGVATFRAAHCTQFKGAFQFAGFSSRIFDNDISRSCRLKISTLISHPV